MVLEYVGAGPEASSGPTAGIENWKHYVLGRWPGGIDLGAWTVRNVRGGTTLSVHAVGRAWDWRYADPAPGGPPPTRPSPSPSNSTRPWASRPSTTT